MNNLKNKDILKGIQQIRSDFKKEFYGNLSLNEAIQIYKTKIIEHKLDQIQFILSEINDDLPTWKTYQDEMKALTQAVSNISSS